MLKTSIRKGLNIPILLLPLFTVAIKIKDENQ